jgi:ribonuclease HI
VTPKHYAVKYRNGSSKIFYGDWDTVCHKVLYRKGVVYKGFKDKADAEKWLEKSPIPYRTKDMPHSRNMHYLYVDGSFSQKTGRSGWGWVIVRNGNALVEDFGSCDNSSGSRNIVGEVYAAAHGVEYCAENKISPIVLVHDYAGIALWPLGHWVARKPVAKEYVEKMKSLMKRIEVRFEKVNGHCGIIWNDYADELTRMYMEDGRQ